MPVTNFHYNELQLPQKLSNCFRQFYIVMHLLMIIKRKNVEQDIFYHFTNFLEAFETEGSKLMTCLM